ncbi:MAG: ring-cleaving dioxygenase [Acidobacteria bacterium]|nr:ring-cleaving dioxygenase [Acidobacteriota bacterium]
MTEKVYGIHHITAIAGDPQRNIDFYTGVLGLRLVKLTVNFDDPGTYHLYYGDEQGRPGTVLTFFAWSGAGALPGRAGAGQVTAVAFTAPPASLAYWQERLHEHGINTAPPVDRFGEPVLAFRDPDGLGLEIVFTETPARSSPSAGPIPVDHVLRGFHSATLSLSDGEATAAFMRRWLGFTLTGERDGRRRLTTEDDGSGTPVDLVTVPPAPNGCMGPGAVHHIAWRTPDEESQHRLLVELRRHGVEASSVRDRTYFRSIYLREPGGVLFEVATDTPGFAVDEPLERLGRELRLPPWLERQRSDIEQALPPLRLPNNE